MINHRLNDNDVCLCVGYVLLIFCGRSSTPQFQKVRQSQHVCALSSEMGIHTCCVGSWMYLFWNWKWSKNEENIVPAISSFNAMKLASIMKKQAPVKKNVDPNRRLFPIASCSFPEEGCSLNEENYPICRKLPPSKESGCGCEAVCWSTKKVAPKVKKILLP